MSDEKCNISSNRLHGRAGHTSKTCFIECVDCAQDLLHTWAEAANAGNTVFLQNDQTCPGLDGFISSLTRKACFACSIASQGAGKSKKTGNMSTSL